MPRIDKDAPVTSLHQSRYGEWRGFEGHSPIGWRCCEEVKEGSGTFAEKHQCSRARGYGPEEAYCAQHAPEAVKAREAEAQANDAERRRVRNLEMAGEVFFKALCTIADGAADPQEVAARAVAEFRANG